MEPARARRADEILGEIAGKGDFPATARAIARLRTVAPREDSNMLALAGVIMQDPGLSTKVLRIVNSAFYRPRDARVATISRAILLLGFDSIRDLATGILLIDSLFANGAAHPALRDNLRRALHGALLAQALAERVGYPGREEAYLLGLFARLGHLWLAAHYREDYARALACADPAGSVSVDDAVYDVIGVKPNDLAAAILERWQLPESYVAHFHRPPPPPGGRAVGAGRLHAVVEAAAAHVAAADLGDPPSPGWLVQCERVLGLHADALGELVERVGGVAREQFALLGLSAEGPRGGRRGRGAAPAARAAGGASPGRPEAPPAAWRDGGGGAAEARGAASGGSVGPAGAPAGAEVVGPEGAGAPRAAAQPDLALAAEIAAEVSRAIVEREPLPNLLAAVLEGIARAGRFDTVALALATAEQDGLRVRLAVGAGPDLAGLAVPLSRDSGTLAETALTRTPRVVEGPAALLVPAGHVGPREDIASFLTVPLLVRERVLGVLLAARSAAAPGVTLADMPVAQLFAQLACVACTAHSA